MGNRHTGKKKKKKKKIKNKYNKIARRDAGPISLWGLGSRTSAGNLVPHVTFGFAAPETWPAVSCGLVAILA